MTREKTAVLLIGHGSRIQNADDAMSQLVELMRKRNEYPIIEKGFLELSPPFIPDGIRRCIEQGAKEVLIIPYFLHQGRHLRRDIPQIIREEAEKYPDIAIRFGNAINFHPLLAEIIDDRIHEAKQTADIRETMPKANT